MGSSSSVDAANSSGGGPAEVQQDDGKLDVEAFKNYKDEEGIQANAIEEGYPEISPPSKKKCDIFEADDMQEPDSHAHGVEPEPNRMLDVVVEELTNPFSSDLHKIRAIFMWIGLQPFNQKRYPRKLDPKSTMGHLKRMALGNLSYAELFTVMCRMAKIPCVMISGVAKASIYEIGDEDVDSLRNVWNSVYVKGDWRLIFPLWGLKAIAGRSTGTWPGKDIILKGEALKEMVLTTINEYYFLTDPEELIFRCMPDESKWQLMKSTFTKTKFISVPLLRPKFFEYGLKLPLGSQEGIIMCEDGVCEVKISYCTKYVQLLPVLLYYNTEANGEHTPVQRHTAVIFEDDAVRFVMRPPKKGVYKLQILDTYNAWVCSFKVICEQPSNLGQFPVEAELGFGPYGDLKENTGLKAKSHTKGMEVIEMGSDVEFVFARSHPMDYLIELVHNEIWEEDLAENVSFNADMGDLIVKVNLDIKGEFVLMIHAKQVGSSDDFDNILNYLLISKEPKKKSGEEGEKESVFKGMDQKVLKTLGLESVVKNDEAKQNEEEDRTRQAKIERMKQMAEQKEKKKIEDVSKMAKQIEADRKRKEDLERVRKALEKAMDSRNVDELERSIEDAKTFPELQDTVQEAEEKYNTLQRMRKHSSQVMEMAQSTISELHRYKEPTVAIHEVMKATFLLLGEVENPPKGIGDIKTVKDWTHIQNLLRKTGKASVMGRVKKFDAMSVPLQTAKRVINILSSYDKYEVTDASAGAGTFFIWASNIAGDVVASH